MAEPTKTKSSAVMSQAEINIIEEKLSLPNGALLVEIAGGLSNRFDKVLDEIDKARSKRIYTERIKNVDERVKAVKDIKKEIAEANQKRQVLIAGWYEKVLAYIVKTYGEAIKDPNGITHSYGERIEVMKNKHLKKYW